MGDQSRPRVWRRLRLGISSAVEDYDAGGRQLHDQLVLGDPVHDRKGIGQGLWSCRNPHLQVCTVLISG